MLKRYIWIVVLIVALFVGLWGYNEFQENQSSGGGLTEEYKKPALINDLETEYDVIVIGGEPEGVAAAVSAARNGAKTLLVEKREELGGLFTYGMLNFLDIPQGEDGESVSKGIFQEWHSLVGRGNAFGILEAKAAFKKMIDDEPNITLAVKTDVLKSISKGNQVTAVKLKNKNGEFEVKGKAFIDATQDADFAAMSDVPYFIGGEDIGIKDKKMAVTPMIHLKNVDWNKVKETALSEKFGVAEVKVNVAWGFSKLHYDYTPVEENTRLRGLNLVKIGEDYYINALQIFGINGLDDASKQSALVKGKRETEHILEYLQKEFPGFENAEIASFPMELYVRETRHIWAEYQLPMSDVWTNKDHWDSIGFGAYPVDVQAQTPQDYGYVISEPKQYAIPFRSIVPKEKDGILVVGRSTGFSSLAAGSARVVPTGMVTGQAAGAAAALAIEERMSFRDMSKNEDLIKTLRGKLEKQGAFVQHIETDYPYMGEWYDSSIQTLMNYGLVVGGYTNDLKVDEPASRHSFVNMLKGAVHRANPEVSSEIRERLDKIHKEVFGTENGPLELKEATSIVAELFFKDGSVGVDSGTGGETGASDLNFQKLINQGIVDEKIAVNIPGENHELQNKEMYTISASIINHITK